MPTQVIKLGVRNIIEGREEFEKHAQVAHDYHKAILAEHLKARSAYRAIRSECFPQLAKVEEQLKETSATIDALNDEIKRARAVASVVSVAPRRVKPKRVPATPEQKIELARLRAMRKEQAAVLTTEREAFKATLTEADVEFRSRLGDTATGARAAAKKRVLAEMLEEDWPEAWKRKARVSAELDRAMKQLRAESGLTQGTYIAVDGNDGSVMQSLKTARIDPDPKHVKWTGGRKVGLQLQGGLSGSDALAGKDNRFAIEILNVPRGRKDPAKRVERDPRGSSQRKRLAIATLRIGKGVTIRCEVLLHRPMPADAKITWAYLVPRQDRGRKTLSLQLTVNTEKPLIERCEGKGKALVTLGWRRESPLSDQDAERGIVVATAGSEEIVLPGSVYRRLRFSDELRGASDRFFQNTEGTGARDQLKDWMAENPSLVPEWMPEMTETIAHWRAHGKLARVARRWTEDYPQVNFRALFKSWKAHRGVSNRKRGRDLEALDLHTGNRDKFTSWLRTVIVADDALAMCTWLQFWRVKDWHMDQMRANSDRKARLCRKDFYRCTAARLSERYGAIELAELNIAQAKRRAGVDQDKDPMPERARYQLKAASPGEFKEALFGAFGKARITVVKCERSADTEIPVPARMNESEHLTAAE